MSTDLAPCPSKYNTSFPDHRHVIIYHASCADGFCAAALLWEALVKYSEVVDVIIIPMHYSQPLPSDLGSHDVVYLVDFSYKRDVMYDLGKLVHHIYVLDHHRTAEKELSQLELTNASIFFDVERSGAMMVFDFVQCMESGTIHQLTGMSELVGTLPLLGSVPQTVPFLVRYVQDRDLWQFKLHKSKEINAYLSSIPFDLKDWAAMLVSMDRRKVRGSMITEGEAILRFQQMQVNKAVGRAVEIHFPVQPGGDSGTVSRIVNTTVNHSEVGVELCIRYDVPFAVTWFHRSDGKFQYSLRSCTGYDVSEIAKAYGGGGHLAAAGFESVSLIKEI